MSPISVIIVNFNTDEEVKRLKAELSSNSNIGNIFVINNSPPGKNLGFSAAANIGIRKALKTGVEKVLLLNPDIEISNNTLDELCKSSGDIVGPVLKFERNGITVFDYGGRVNWILGRTKHFENVESDSGPASQRGEQARMTREVEYISGACMMIKRSVFEKIRLFDERFFMYFEDVDFCLRAKKAGFTINVDSKIVVQHQISEHKFSNDNQKINYNLHSNLHFIQKWLPWYFKTTAYFYLLFLNIKNKLKLVNLILISFLEAFIPAR